MSQALVKAAEVALGRQRAPQHEIGDNVVPYLRSANVVDGRLDLSDVKSMNFSPSEQGIFRLEPGDVLVTEGSGSRDTVGASAVWRGEMPGTVCFQNTLLRLRPRQGVSEGRYIAWWARHAHASSLMAAVASGANILHLGAENLRRLQIELPSLDEQRRIADFLDDQVSRIDHAMALRSAQRSSVEARWVTLLWEAFARTADGAIPLKRIAWWREGPGILAEDFREEGTPLLRIANVRGSRLTMDGCGYLDPVMARQRWGHLAVHDGELLTSGSASAGLAVEVPPEADGAIPYTGLIRIGPRGSGLLKEYLRYFLLSRRFIDQVDSLKTGIGIQHWGPYHLSQVSMPVASPARQRLVVEFLHGEDDTRAAMMAAIDDGLDLMHERKRALITAAVTGEFDVTAASGRSVG